MPATTKETEKKTTKNNNAETQKPIIPTDISPNQFITVKNGFNGKLVYKSKRTGEKFVWEEFGAEQDMELGELKNARNSNKKYFENNYFMFDEDWVVYYLGVDRYYKNALSLDEFDTVFKEAPAKLEKIIGSLSAGQKHSLSYRARQLIANGEIDSHKVILTLEKCLGVQLIER